MPDDYKEELNKHKEARQAPAENEEPKRLGKKDTKRWCKGKVGREHETVCMTYGEMKGESNYFGFFSNWYYLVCKKCGKELESWSPRSKKRKAKPDWVK